MAAAVSVWVELVRSLGHHRCAGHLSPGSVVLDAELDCVAAWTPFAVMSLAPTPYRLTVAAAAFLPYRLADTTEGEL